MTRPGSRLRPFLALWCSDKTLWQCIDPAIADLQAEYMAAARQGRLWHSRWLLLVGYVGVIKLVVLFSLRWSFAISAWPSVERRTLGRTIRWCGVATTAIVTLFVAPEYRKYVETVGVNVRLIAYLVPYALTLAIPVGLMLGIAGAVRQDTRSRRVVVAVAALAVACAVATWVNLNWVTPAANQAFRSEVFAITNGGDVRVSELPQKGINEMTLAELRELSRSSDDNRAWRAPRLAEMAYLRRLTAAFAPVPLAVLALTFNSRSAVWRVLAATAAAILWVAAGQMAGWSVRHAVLPPTLALWLPHVAYVAMAAWNAQVFRRRLSGSAA